MGNSLTPVEQDEEFFLNVLFSLWVVALSQLLRRMFMPELIMGPRQQLHLITGRTCKTQQLVHTGLNSGNDGVGEAFPTIRP